jgi:hypothetical protein
MGEKTEWLLKIKANIDSQLKNEDFLGMVCPECFESRELCDGNGWISLNGDVFYYCTEHKVYWLYDKTTGDRPTGDRSLERHWITNLLISGFQQVSPVNVSEIFNLETLLKTQIELHTLKNKLNEIARCSKEIYADPILENEPF